MKIDTNKEIIFRFIQAINDHDVNGIVSLMSDDHIFIDAMDHKTVGKKEMEIGWKGYFELFPDYKIEILEIIGDKSLFGLFGYASATYKKTDANFWRIPAAWKGIVEKRRIKHWQVYCDYSNLLRIMANE
jgi:ketosteroid isomerase-like protein